MTVIVFSIKLISVNLLEYTIDFPNLILQPGCTRKTVIQLSMSFSEIGTALEVKDFVIQKKIMEQIYKHKQELIVKYINYKMQNTIKRTRCDIKTEFSKKRSEFTNNVKQNFNVSTARKNIKLNTN